MIQNAGLGKLKPNILVMGYKDDWITSSYENIVEYSDVIHDAFDFNYGVAILRLPKGTHLDEDESDSAGEFSECEDTDGEMQGTGQPKKPKEMSVKIEMDVESDPDSAVPASTPMILRDSKNKSGDNTAESPASAKASTSTRKQKEQIMIPLTEKQKGIQSSFSSFSRTLNASIVKV